MSIHYCWQEHGRDTQHCVGCQQQTRLVVMIMTIVTRSPSEASIKKGTKVKWPTGQHSCTHRLCDARVQCSSLFPWSWAGSGPAPGVMGGRPHTTSITCCYLPGFYTGTNFTTGDKGSVSSVLWRCWLGSRKGIRPVKIWETRCWRGYLLEQSANILLWFSWWNCHPSSLLQQNPEWFILLVPTHLGSPGQRVVKRL